MPSISKRIVGAIALAVALPLAATACGGGEGGGGDTIVIGTKFDQPGLGLKNPDGTMSGFDTSLCEYSLNVPRPRKIRAFPTTCSTM